MGQVLGFAHCKEAPSTASTTPDSTEGGNEEPDFSELGGSLDPPEEEEEDEDEAGGGPTGGAGLWGPPRELTFSYIAFKGGGTSRRRGRPPQSRLSSGSPRKSEPPPPPTRTPPKRPEEPPPRPSGGELEMGGGLLDWGGPEVEEPPMRLGPPPPPTPPPAPPPTPPKIPEPPPAPPDQSASPLGADGWAAPAGAMEGTVWRLLYWEAPGRSALVLLGTLGTLGCLARFSAVTVLSHAALAALAVTASLRLRRVTLRVLRRHPPPGPPCPAQEGPVGLSPEEQQRWARRLARHLVTATRTLTRLFLVQSVPESLKFAFFFYLLTYVGAVCNGVTLLGAGVICAFTFPVLYRHYQAQIDQYMSMGRNHLSHLRARFKAKLPSAKAKPQ